jgi:hypothetical protein
VNRVQEIQSERIRAALRPALEDGEQVEVVCSAAVGSISVARMMGTALVVGALTAGTLIAFRVPKKLYVGLTDRRLIFLEGNIMSGRPTSKVALQLGRPVLASTSTRPKRTMALVPTLVVDLAIAGSDTGLRLTFPTPCRDEGRQIAAALTPPAS